MSVKIGMTLERFIIEEQRIHPAARGEFSGLLAQIALAGKIIYREVNKAGLAEALGLTGRAGMRAKGEPQRLELFAQQAFVSSLDHSGYLCIMASEESDGVIEIPPEFACGSYVLLFDPLDGSSNIDVNVNVGSIFSIFRRKSHGDRGTLEDCLQKGIYQVGAGYLVYGSSAMLVYSTGYGVNGFTLDPSLGEFLLSHPNIRTPSRGSIFSINEGNASYWEEGTRRYVNYLKEKDEETGRPYSARYIGSLVADFHRNLLKGGIFLYPKDLNYPQGKLRLLNEANPLAFIAEQAGGAASTGFERIMEVVPTRLDQRTPLIIGSKEDVADYEEFIQDKR